MDFATRTLAQDGSKYLGVIFGYALFTAILSFMLVYTKRVSVTAIPVVCISTLLIAGFGALLTRVIR